MLRLAIYHRLFLLSRSREGENPFEAQNMQKRFARVQATHEGWQLVDVHVLEGNSLHSIDNDYLFTSRQTEQSQLVIVKRTNDETARMLDLQWCQLSKRVKFSIPKIDSNHRLLSGCLLSHIPVAKLRRQCLRLIFDNEESLVLVAAGEDMAAVETDRLYEVKWTHLLIKFVDLCDVWRVYEGENDQTKITG